MAPNLLTEPDWPYIRAEDLADACRDQLKTVWNATDLNNVSFFDFELLFEEFLEVC
jgi:hypothetical protein